MILLPKVVLVIPAEEPVKDGKQQENDDSIQDNQLDLCLGPRSQAIHLQPLCLGVESSFQWILASNFTLPPKTQE